MENELFEKIKLSDPTLLYPSDKHNCPINKFLLLLCNKRCSIFLIKSFVEIKRHFDVKTFFSEKRRFVKIFTVLLSGEYV